MIKIARDLNIYNKLYLMLPMLCMSLLFGCQSQQGAPAQQIAPATESTTATSETKLSPVTDNNSKIVLYGGKETKGLKADGPSEFVEPKNGIGPDQKPIAPKLDLIVGVKSDVPTENKIIPPSLQHMKFDYDDMITKITDEVKSGNQLPDYYMLDYVFNNPFIDNLPFKSGSVVADISAGTGALQVQLLLKKLPYSKMYAIVMESKSQKFLSFLLKKYFPIENNKIKIVLADPLPKTIPDGSLDFAVMNDPQYLEAVPKGQKEPPIVEYLKSLKSAFKPGASIYVYLNWSPADQQHPDKDHRKKAIDYTKKPFTDAGYRFVSSEVKDNVLQTVFKL